MKRPHAEGRIRVLAVDHTAGIAPFRKKFAALAAHPEIDLTVVAPNRWVENYREVRTLPGGDEGFRFAIGRVGWPGYENRAFFLSGLGAAIRRSRPQILHLWEEPYSVISLQAMWHAALWAREAQLVFSSADNMSGSFHYAYRPSWFYAAVERLAQRRCAAGTAITEEVAETLRRKGFSKPIEIVPLALDLAAYPGNPEIGEADLARRASPAATLNRFGLPSPIVGYVGRLLPVKGVDLLLRAVAALPAPRPSLVIVGEGPERYALETMASDLGIGATTRFLPLVAHEDVPALLSSIDVLVLPSRTTPRQKEQFGRVLIEGMAAGCVVIGSSSGGIPHVLGDAGLVFPEENWSALATEIRRAIDDSELARERRVRGRRRVRERYTWDAVAAELLGFYRRLLGRAPGSEIAAP